MSDRSIARAVLGEFQRAALQQFGDASRWAEISSLSPGFIPPADEFSRPIELENTGVSPAEIDELASKYAALPDSVRLSILRSLGLIDVAHAERWANDVEGGAIRAVIDRDVCALAVHCGLLRQFAEWVAKASAPSDATGALDTESVPTDAEGGE